MNQTYDVIVLGLGAMGGSTAYHVAKRGLKVLGLERFTPAHDRGSSHGRTRVIRQSYYEDPAYVPLLIRAYELWRELEAETNERLLFETGGLMIGAPSSSVFSGSRQSASIHGLPHEILDASEVARRFPAMKPEPDQVAIYEERAGYLLSERCVLAHVRRANDFHAELRFEEKVEKWEALSGGEGIRVKTSRGEYEAGRLVVCPGPWAPEVLAGIGLPLEVKRQVLYWFDVRGGIQPFLPENFPIFIQEAADGQQFYGFPAIDGPKGGVKVAFHHAPRAAPCTPETIDRTVHPEEIQAMWQAAVRLLPDLDATCLSSVTCMYTNTPDQNFVLARHPEYEEVVIGCGFSGHGFKFSSVMGEILADFITKGSTSFDIGFLRPQRFAVAHRRDTGPTHA